MIEEYRRFLYLCCTAGREMTPSEEVDAAWHLHLLYTRSYWDDLCGKVLRRPLHHNPTSGGARERKRFHEAYAATLAAYETAFCETPPPDIWPDVATRFTPSPDKVDYWRMPKAPFRWLASALRWNVAILLMLLCVTDAPLAAGGKSYAAHLSDGTVNLIIFVMVCLIIWAIFFYEPKGGGGGCGGGGCGGGGDSGCGGGGCGGGCV